jgi:hypothetical protein
MMLRPQGGGRRVGMIAMRRRLGVIVALGALLCVLGGVVTASPALAGRGHKWQLGSAEPFTVPALFCGFKVRVTFPVNKEFTKILKTADGSMTFLFTGAVTASFTNLQTGKTITEKMNGPGQATIGSDGSITRGAYGAERALLSHASQREAVRAAHRERDRGQAGVLGRGERGHHLAFPQRSRPGGRVRRVELRDYPGPRGASGALRRGPPDGGEWAARLPVGVVPAPVRAELTRSLWH